MLYADVVQADRLARQCSQDKASGRRQCTRQLQHGNIPLLCRRKGAGAMARGNILRLPHALETFASILRQLTLTNCKLQFGSKSTGLRLSIQFWISCNAALRSFITNAYLGCAPIELHPLAREVRPAA
mmetsp:Transcript_4322/g.12696  ORF Transcript_4322/g.12696 Transcript_4322/m.12696 type:complete len:128 (+) Transcript_4322:219-602(+)